MQQLQRSHTCPQEWDMLRLPCQSDNYCVIRHTGAMVSCYRCLLCSWPYVSQGKGADPRAVTSHGVHIVLLPIRHLQSWQKQPQQYGEGDVATQQRSEHRANSAEGPWGAGNAAKKHHAEWMSQKQAPWKKPWRWLQHTPNEPGKECCDSGPCHGPW